MKNTNNTGKVPSVLAIHDLSCFGRCALTVVIPTMSAMGVQVVPIPTALLSTHTGGFEGFHFKDMTDDMERIADHLSEIGVECDAIYTGFLGSEKQIETVLHIIEMFGKKKNGETVPVYVDPVMGDDGRLYSTYNEKMMRGMRRLCEKADIITPNFTEACFLTDTPYINTQDMSEREALDHAEKICRKLLSFGAKRIVVTGLHYNGSMVGTFGCDAGGSTPITFLHGSRHIDRSYPGTGDLFASVLFGSLMQGRSFDEAVRLASDFTRETIEFTSLSDSPTRNGVAFEALLAKL